MSKKTAKKKVSKKKVASKSSSPVTSIQDNAHEIWLAGLGAFALAQEEGVNLIRKGGELVNKSGELVNKKTGKVVDEGSKLFERLVAEGKKLENKGRKLAGDTVGGVKNDVEGRVDKTIQSARTNWDKLEKVFEDRVARALSRLGVPTSEEIQQLSERVQELNVRVRELAKDQKSSAAKPAAKKTTKKAAAKSSSESKS